LPDPDPDPDPVPSDEWFPLVLALLALGTCDDVPAALTVSPA